MRSVIDENLTNRHFGLACSNEKKLRKSINEDLEDRKLFYSNKKYPLCINPLIIDKNEFEDFNSIATNFINLLYDLALHIKNNKSLMDVFLKEYPSMQILRDSLDGLNYEDLCRNFYRLDGIIADNQFKIIEANTDSPGGIFTLQSLHESFYYLYRNNIDRSFSKNFSKGAEKVLDNFVDLYNKRCSEGELFLVVGKKHDSERFEHRLIAKRLRERGIPARCIDYRDSLSLNSNGLFYRGDKVGVVYRRVFPMDKTKKIVDASKKGLVNSINPTYSYLLASKSLMAFMHKFKDSILIDHKNFIEKYVCPTFFASDFSKSELIDNKDKYVLKRTGLDGGQGIHIGKSESLDSWKEILNSLGDDCIVQTYFEAPKRRFLDNNYENAELRRFDFNLYCIGKEFIMPYVRVNAKGKYKSNNSCGSSEGLCFF